MGAAHERGDICARRDNPFSAYPKATNRIAALERLSREMGSGDRGGGV
jgi:hypothetical protein